MASQRIYVASSWRNKYQPWVVTRLREDGFRVYDFRHRGFSWGQIDPQWEGWKVEDWLMALDDPIACEGFRRDFEAMKWADTVVMVLPCGRSAHLELGWAVGRKRTAILIPEERETPDLMVKMVDRLFTAYTPLVDWLREG